MANSKTSNISQHSAQFRDAASSLGHDVQELGKITKKLAGDTMGAIRENAGEYYQQGVEKAHKMEESLEKTIKENPLKSCLVAAGVGLLVGILMKRH